MSKPLVTQNLTTTNHKLKPRVVLTALAFASQVFTPLLVLSRLSRHGEWRGPPSQTLEPSRFPRCSIFSAAVTPVPYLPESEFR